MVQTDGGYLGADVPSFVSAVVSAAPGVFSATLLEDADISISLTVTPGQDVHISGDASLAVAPRWGSGGFTVEERGSLSLTYVDLGASTITVESGASLTAQGSRFSGALAVSGAASLSGCTLATIDLSGGSLSLASMAVPSGVFSAAKSQLSGAGSTLRLSAVTLAESPDAGELTGTMAVAADGTKTVEPPNWGRPCAFVVTSGPCTVSDDGRCVGRPDGYMPDEQCAITVVGVGGMCMLGACPVFDMWDDDSVTLPGGSEHYYSDCPVGTALTGGDAVAWSSNNMRQGSVGHGGYDSGCGPKGTCGLPYNDAGGLGGGWEICFA